MSKKGDRTSGSKPSAGGSAARYELRFTVWQFVRVMVRLEEARNLTGADPLLKHFYERWEDFWVDLDAQLVDLGRNDPDGFAELMMDQEVVCEDISEAERRLVIRLIREVIEELKRTLRNTEDPASVEDLSFERDELNLLAKEFGNLKPV